MQALLKRYAGSDAVRGPFPSVRVGCAISYDVDFSRYRSGLMPMEMPASQNGMSTMFGVYDRPYDFRKIDIRVASRGRYVFPGNSNAAADTIELGAMKRSSSGVIGVVSLRGSHDTDTHRVEEAIDAPLASYDPGVR